METAYSFRAMNRLDIAQVAELERRCFTLPWSADALRGELRNKIAHYQLLLIDEVIQGYSGMWVFLGEAHITNVAIAPEYRNQGLGKALMLHMMRMACEYKAQSMTLEVRASNEAAKALYASLGFEKAGERKRYYSDTGENAWILWNLDIAATLETFDKA